MHPSLWYHDFSMPILELKKERLTWMLPWLKSTFCIAIAPWKIHFMSWKCPFEVPCLPNRWMPWWSDWRRRLVLLPNDNQHRFLSKYIRQGQVARQESLGEDCMEAHTSYWLALFGLCRHCSSGIVALQISIFYERRNEYCNLRTVSSTPYLSLLLHTWLTWQICPRVYVGVYLLVSLDLDYCPSLRTPV